jgi:hypothetical protein
VTASDPLRTAASGLAVLSLLAVVGVGVTAAVVQSREDDGGSSGTLRRNGGDDGPAGFDYTGWSTVAGPASITYKVPPGAAWEIGSTSDPVGFRDDGGGSLVNGSAAAFFYGNDCSDDGERVPAAWAVVADAEQGEVEEVAVSAAQDWAEGYATGPDGTVAPLTGPEVTDTELADGTAATTARIGLDMTVFEGPCVRDSAELTSVSFARRSRVRTLVVARYVDSPGTISAEEYDAILGSLEP